MDGDADSDETQDARPSYNLHDAQSQVAEKEETRSPLSIASTFAN